MTDKEKELQAEAIGYYRKRIAELEKSCDETQELLDKQIEATYRLDKENAELKHIIATLRQEKDNVSMHAKAMEVVAKTRSEQLTKSKELLERFLNVGDLWEFDGNAFLKLQSDVTQFLKYSEVEK